MLDLAKVRAFYFDAPAPEPSRMPTREELYARHERERFENCLLRGGDPEAEGLGPHGSLIGGPGRPLTVFHGFPEQRAKIDPLPLSWFDHPRGHTRLVPPGGIPEAHTFFASLSGAYLAGMPDRPSGPQLRRYFRSPEPGPRARSQIWHVFACIHPFDLHRIVPRGAVSLYEAVRALQITKTRRAAVVAWFNQFGVRPRKEPREGEDEP